jgi:hypothetical protein
VSRNPAAGFPTKNTNGPRDWTSQRAAMSVTADVMTLSHAERDRLGVGLHVDHRDLVIEELAASERRLTEHVALAESERDGYRVVAQQAIHALHREQLEAKRLREALERLRDEFRSLRIRTMRVAA